MLWYNYVDVPVFAQLSADGENAVWSMILQKAMAKFWGTYESMRFGFVNIGVSMLTGMPGMHYRTDKVSKQALLGHIKNARENHDVLNFSTPNTSSGYIQGLNDKHAFSILDVIEVDDLVLIKCRDPYGTGKEDNYTGKFNDSDTENWTDELKEAVGFHDKLPGVFFMDYDTLYDVTNNLFRNKNEENRVVSNYIVRDFQGETAAGWGGWLRSGKGVEASYEFVSNIDQVVDVTPIFWRDRNYANLDECSHQDAYHYAILYIVSLLSRD